MAIFKLESTDGGARAGTLHTEHGDGPTPAFMPVASQGSVKTLDPADLRALGAAIVLANTYHLYLRPGVDVISGLGGLHRFMGWDGPVLTDSGGFQGFSLERLREITDDAIIFKSHLDGSLHTFSPEAAIAHQEALGADITSLGFQGYAVGGLSVGESKSEMYEAAAFTTEMLPVDAPRYLMGVGYPEDLVECVARGVDMFDCVLPTRIARNGALLVSKGRVNVYTAPFKTRDGPIEEGCDCYTCVNHSAAYVHHLFRAKELLAYRLATIHNLRSVLRLMEEMRAVILEGRFEAFRAAFFEGFVPTDPDTRRAQKRKWLDSQQRAHRGGTGQATGAQDR